MDTTSQGAGTFFSRLFNQSHVVLLAKDPSLIPYTSVAAGLFTCKMIYDITHLASASYIKSYSGLSKIKKIEWNNRGISTIHAIYITTMALYFTFWSDVFANNKLAGPVSFQRSSLSTFGLGVSAGYFISDLAMIFWFYPSIGGLEYVVHHLLSLSGVVYSMVTGEGQIYAYMNLISEVTTPGINLRWYIDAAGLKNSKAYLVNGVGMFLAWVVARIMLFVYIFYYVYWHFDQVKQMHTLGILLATVAPSVFFVLNVMWFGKIVKGLKKTLAAKSD